MSKVIEISEKRLCFGVKLSLFCLKTVEVTRTQFITVCSKISSISEDSDYSSMSRIFRKFSWVWLFRRRHANIYRRTNVSMYFNSDYFIHHFDSRVELSQCSFTSCYRVMLSSFEQKMYIFSKRYKVRLLSSLLMSSRSLECIKSILQLYTRLKHQWCWIVTIYSCRSIVWKPSKCWWYKTMSYQIIQTPMFTGE